MEYQNGYALQFPYSFIIYYINCVYLRIGLAGCILKNLDENQWKKFQSQKHIDIMHFTLNWGRERVLEHKY